MLDIGIDIRKKICHPSHQSVPRRLRRGHGFSAGQAASAAACPVLLGRGEDMHDSKRLLRAMDTVFKGLLSLAADDTTRKSGYLHNMQR